MMTSRRFDRNVPLRFALAVSFAIGAASPVTARTEAPTLAPAKEVLEELRTAPRDNEARVERLKELFEQAGADPEAIVLQPVEGRGPDDPLLHNVIAIKPGETDRVIVIGGHLDKVPPGDGVIDDWSGTAMAANLYQALRDVPTRHTFVFMGFAYEEQGLVGSRKYVEELEDDERERFAAMVNLECLGVAGPFVWSNGSNDDLEALAYHVAEQAELPLEKHEILGVGADSIPFERAGIPTITFDGLPKTHFRLIHSDEDRFENVDQEIYVRSYELIAAYLLELDTALDDLFDEDAPEREPAP